MEPWWFLKGADGVVAVTMWLVVSIVITYLGGWYRLAKRYPLPLLRASDRRCWFASGKLGLVSYSMSLNVGVDSAGLYLSTPFLFMAPRLYIAWGSLRLVRYAKRWRLFTVARYQLDSGDVLELYGSAAKLVYEVSEASAMKRSAFNPSEKVPTIN